ncbi:MAG: hypothetical protein KatS3mg130_2009 [Candidatus Sumerlaea sp.]|nr:MAG: hypothetical protein KatS3mg130_2009 [Candidatus Sumerlaea sp.]
MSSSGKNKRVDRRVRELVGELAALCQGAEVALFLNASLLHHISELPLSVGIHFGAATWHLRNSYVSGARDTLRSIGYSAHEIAEAQQVAQEGAHYVDTQSHLRHTIQARYT